MSERADRLSKKRKETEGKIRERAGVDEADETEQPSEPSELDEPEQTDEPDESDETPVKDEQVGTYLYLPEGQREELRYRYKLLAAEYEREFGEDFEKNRHYYPLVVQYGLDRLESADVTDVKELLDELDY